LGNAKRPRIAVTMGDPAGVGPEIVVQALRFPEVVSVCRPVVYGDAGILRRAAAVLGQAVEVAEGGESGPGRIVVRSLSSLSPDEVPFGRISEAGSRAMADYIREAARDALAGAPTEWSPARSQRRG